MDRTPTHSIGNMIMRRICSVYFILSATLLYSVRFRIDTVMKQRNPIGTHSESKDLQSGRGYGAWAAGYLILSKGLENNKNEYHDTTGTDGNEPVEPAPSVHVLTPCPDLLDICSSFLVSDHLLSLEAYPVNVTFHHGRAILTLVVPNPPKPIMAAIASSSSSTPSISSPSSAPALEVASDP